MAPLPKVKDTAAKAAFDTITARLDGLRPQLREVLISAYLDHPAYFDGAFPIWWLGQPRSKIFLVERKPPAFVRFSHQPNLVVRGRSLGLSVIQPFAEHKDVAFALMAVIREAFHSGEVLPTGGLEVLLGKVAGHDPLPSKSLFMGSVIVDWSIPPTSHTLTPS